MLYIYINHLRQRNIPIERSLFHYLKELILHSFNAHIVALFLMHICDRLNIYKEGAVKKYIGFLMPKQFLQYIEDICVIGFSFEISHEANKLAPPQPFAYRGS